MRIIKQGSFDVSNFICNLLLHVEVRSQKNYNVRYYESYKKNQ